MLIFFVLLSSLSTFWGGNAVVRPAPRIGILVHAGRALDDLGCLPIRLVSATQLCGLSHQRGLDRPENPDAAQHFLPGLSCQPVLPEAERDAFLAQQKGVRVQESKCWGSPNNRGSYWLVCLAISQFTIFHPCPISGGCSGFSIPQITGPSPSNGVKMLSWLTYVNIAKSCRLQNRIFSIYPNLSGIALLFLFFNVFCTYKYPFCWRDLIAGISTFAAP